MMSFLCHLGLHSWPRVHGNWREPVVEPSEADCRRCQHRLASIWRVVYPADGSRCGRFCQIHGQKDEGRAMAQMQARLTVKYEDEKASL
jgi:hypothetical protein